MAGVGLNYTCPTHVNWQVFDDKFSKTFMLYMRSIGGLTLESLSFQKAFDFLVKDMNSQAIPYFVISCRFFWGLHPHSNVKINGCQ